MSICEKDFENQLEEIKSHGHNIMRTPGNIICLKCEVRAPVLGLSNDIGPWVGHDTGTLTGRKMFKTCKNQ